MNEIFVVDVHKDQLIYLDDPQPIIPQKKSNRRGRKPHGIRHKFNLSVLITGKKHSLKQHGNTINCATVPKVS
jgi:hypothetical protein